MKFVSLTGAFDSRVKQKVLGFLFGNYTSMSEREMAKLLGISHSSVNRIMREFRDLDLVYPKRLGNVVIWERKEGSLAFIELKKIVDKMKAIPLPKEHLIATLRNELARTKVKRAVLFGSVLKGKERSGSDIDLFLLVPDGVDLGNKLDELSDKCLKLYGNPLMAYVLTEKEFKHPPNPFLMQEIEAGLLVYPNPGVIVNE